MRDAVLPSTFVVALLLLARPSGAPSVQVGSVMGTSAVGECADFERILVARLEGSTDADVFIATVSDPHTSGLAYGFDLGVDAIERALAQSGYALDAFWLPWRSESDAGPDCVDRPGVISGRRAHAAGATPVLVLLVGETPTTGVNTAQLACAQTFLGREMADASVPRCVSRLSADKAQLARSVGTHILWRG